MSSFDRQDKYGETIKAGDVCAINTNNRIQLAVYKEGSWGGKKTKGEFGRFIASDGQHSCKFTSVVFVFDPMGERRSKSKELQESIRTYYEGEKK